MTITYKCPNTRRCYWLLSGRCLKKHQGKCSNKCPDYLSVAKVKQVNKDKYW